MAPLIIAPTPNISLNSYIPQPPATEGSLKVYPSNGKHRQIVRALALIGYTIAPGWSGSLAGGRLLPRVIQLSGGA
jgi:hypothetical protein